jgi:RNA polymerase sigma-70 factor (ECF subfamily)
MEKNPEQLSDADIIGQILQGRRDLFGLLVKRYWKMSVALAVCRCWDPAAAEDLAQDSFLKAYTNLSSLHDRMRFGGWLSKIVIRECHTYHREKKRKQIVAPMEDAGVEPILVCAARENPGLTEEQVRFVHACVGRLPQRLQKVVLMRFIGGFTVRQIADQIGKECGTVRVRLHRALKLLKEQLAPILEEVQ